MRYPTCRICTSWSLFHLILPYISVIGLSVTRSRSRSLSLSLLSRFLPVVSSLSLVSANPWAHQLYRYRCTTLLSLLSSPCFADLFAPSTPTSPIFHLSLACCSSALPLPVFAVYPALFSVVVCFLYRVNPSVGRFPFLSLYFLARSLLCSGLVSFPP